MLIHMFVFKNRTHTNRGGFTRGQRAFSQREYQAGMQQELDEDQSLKCYAGKLMGSRGQSLIDSMHQ